MEFVSMEHARQGGQQEAVIVHLHSAELPEEFWQLNERLYEFVERSGAGEFDGNEIGEGEATLFAYGPDAGILFSVMEPLLRSYGVCQNARVVIRKGGPGSPQTELQLKPEDLISDL
jgi:hypothetical protein